MVNFLASASFDVNHESFALSAEFIQQDNLVGALTEPNFLGGCSSPLVVDEDDG